MDKVDINVNELRLISTSMRTKIDGINSIYTTTISPVINSSKECLVASGLNFDEINEAYKTAFTTLNNDLNEITDTLINKVIPKYEEINKR